MLHKQRPHTFEAALGSPCRYRFYSTLTNRPILYAHTDRVTIPACQAFASQERFALSGFPQRGQGTTVPQVKFLILRPADRPAASGFGEYSTLVPTEASKGNYRCPTVTYGSKFNHWSLSPRPTRALPDGDGRGPQKI